ncbi:MAG: cupredoxin domain-containing protein [Nitrospirae bacterium]|nr:cupredoxin domain-containing protein [Nitrospirota bacterium]
MIDWKYLFRIAAVATAIALAALAVVPSFPARLSAENISPVASQGNEQIIRITAKRFEYMPNKIKLKKGVAVILNFTSLDRHHGFNCPGLGIRADIFPGQANNVRIVPQKAGTYEFHCDVFCGGGHEDMSGEIIVED